MKNQDFSKHTRGFTLLELLIVIAIIAIISAFLILVLNPAETLRKGRDSQRISDLSTINRAIAFYITISFNPDLDGSDFTRGVCGANAFVGRGGSPDITATSTSGLTLIQPDGDSAISTIDGTGWIPVNFASISGGSPVPRLPLDPSYRVDNPADVSDDDLLYIYGCDMDTTYELNANLESKQFSSGGDDDRESTDGGNNPNVFEVGTKLTILGTSGTGGGGGQTFVLNLQVGASGDDGFRPNSGLNTVLDYIYQGKKDIPSADTFHSFYRWTGVTISGTIVDSYVEIYTYQSATIDTAIYGVNEDNPVAPITGAEYDADSETTASVDWDFTSNINTWERSPSLNYIFQEIIESHTIENEAVIIKIKNEEAAFGNYYWQSRSYEYNDHSFAAKLHIEYTVP